MGIPLVLLLAGILLYVYLLRRRANKHASLDAATTRRSRSVEHLDDDPHAAPYMRSLGTVWNPSEADGFPVHNGSAGPSARASARHSRHGSELDVKRESAHVAHSTPAPPYEPFGEDAVHELHGDERFRG